MERAQQLAQMTAKHRERIVGTADYIWENPETGYREWKTSAYMEKQFRELGYEREISPAFTRIWTRGDLARRWPSWGNWIP